MKIVDTHVHLYHTDETLYPMLAEPNRPPPGTGSLLHLHREMRRGGVSRAVIVQTGSAYGRDNRLVLDTVRDNREWTVGVCRLDPSDPETPGLLEQYAAKGIRGIRMEPVGELYPMFYNPGATRMWDVAQRLGIVVCAHLQWKLLPQLADLLARYPAVSVVLDHAGYVSVKNDGSLDSLLELTRFRNLYIKLSHVVMGTQQGYPFADMHEGVQQVVDAFGADRCMWGSNFPCEHWLKKATYEEHLDVMRKEIGLNEEELQAILVDTPSSVWFPE
jgi:L-fuconolactonase